MNIQNGPVYRTYELAGGTAANAKAKAGADSLQASPPLIFVAADAKAATSTPVTLSEAARKLSLQDSTTTKLAAQQPTPASDDIPNHDPIKVPVSWGPVRDVR